MTDPPEHLNTSAPVNLYPERVHSDNYVLNELKRVFADNTDAFGKLIADGTRNNLDIASQYSFSPERLRLYNNGSRQYVQYGDFTNFTDAEDTWTLQPDAGDRMHLESAESSTYAVGYALSASLVLDINQELTDGDVLKVGAYNDSDGWYLEQRGSDHTPTQVDVKQLRAGTETTLQTDVELPRPTTEWARYELRYNWYGVGNQVWKQTYTEDGKQFNDYVAKTSVDGDIGPQTGNLNLRYEIEASSATSGLVLEGGSMAFITLGDPTSLSRSKKQYAQVSTSGTADAWEPLYAVRIDPTNDAVNMQFSNLDIVNFDGNATIEFVAAAFDADKTDATGWSRPDYHHEQNSALQATTNVSQVAIADGTMKTPAAGEKYGGYTVASSVALGGGGASGEASTETGLRQEKKSVLASDNIVLLARTDGAATLDFVYDIDQNW